MRITISKTGFHWGINQKVENHVAWNWWIGKSHSVLREGVMDAVNQEMERVNPFVVWN